MLKNAITLASDREIFPAAVFLAWRLSALNSRADTQIVLFSDWKEGIEQARLLAPAVTFLECDFHEPDYGKHQPSLWEKTSYFRFCLPRMLPHISRTLHLDIDMFVTSEKLFALMDLDLRGRPMAAVRALDYFGVQKFNAGTMLIDAEVYRQQQAESRAFEMIRAREKLSYVSRDQAILNEMYKGEWLELSPVFNLTSRYMNTELAAAFPPVVLHFIGPLKQWVKPLSGEYHRAGIEMDAFLKNTPWKNFVGSANQNPQVPNMRMTSLREFENRFPRFVEFVTTTEFADVAQGLTQPRFDLLNARHV